MVRLLKAIWRSFVSSFLPPLIVVGVLKALWTILFQRYFLHEPWAQHTFADIGGWIQFIETCQKGSIPYLDFSREYPHLAGYFFWMVGKVQSALELDFLIFHMWLIWLIDLINLVLFWKILKELKISSVKAWFATLLLFVAPTTLFLGPFRFESLMLVFVLWGLLADMKKAPLWATFAWAIGFHIKWFPVFVLLARDFQFVRKKQWSVLLKSWSIFFAVTLVALGVPALIEYLKYGSILNTTDPYVFHAKRHLFTDTVLGILELMGFYLPWEKWTSLTSILLMLFFAVFPAKLRLEPRVVLICISSLILNRMYSPQFHIWFIPFLLIFLVESSRRRDFWILFGAFLILEGLNMLVYPFSFTKAFDELGGFDSRLIWETAGPWSRIFAASIMLRALLLIGLVLWILRISRTGKMKALR